MRYFGSFFIFYIFLKYSFEYLQLKEVEEKLEVATKEQEALIDIFSEEQIRRDKEEERLKKKLKVSWLFDY